MLKPIIGSDKKKPSKEWYESYTCNNCLIYGRPAEHPKGGDRYNCFIHDYN